MADIKLGREFVNNANQGVDCASPVDVASYTCPAGKTAILRGYKHVWSGGTTAVAKLQAFLSGLQFDLKSVTAPAGMDDVASGDYQVCLRPGDIVKIRCSTGQGSITADAFVCVEEERLY